MPVGARLVDRRRLGRRATARADRIDLALLLKVVPVVARQEPCLLEVLAKTPARRLLSPARSRPWPSARRSPIAKPPYIRSFADRYGLTICDQFETADEIGFVVRVRQRFARRNNYGRRFYGRQFYGRPWPRYFLYDRLACLLAGRELRERPMEVFLLPDRLRRLFATLGAPLIAYHDQRFYGWLPGPPPKSHSRSFAIYSKIALEIADYHRHYLIAIALPFAAKPRLCLWVNPG